MTTMRDLQGDIDDRGIELEHAGICGLTYPIDVVDVDGTPQRTVADVTLSVALPEAVRGTHMSRFVEVLHAHHGAIGQRSLPQLCATLRERLDAARTSVRFDFPWFIEKAAPVSGATAFADYRCSLRATADVDSCSVIVGVSVPVTSLCPCSKAISDYGAHNQRGTIALELVVREAVSVRELVLLAEGCASAPVYPLLKRADERHVTMQAYDTPSFVEDMARDVAARLKRDDRVERFRVEVTNQESIHNHAAFAVAQHHWLRER
jgi:GTP cyclohydrolase I